MEFKVDQYFSVTGSLIPTVTEEPLITKQSISTICSNSSEEAVLIRLLLGTTSICYIESGERWWQDKNYSVLGAPESEIKTASALEKTLHSIDIERESLDIYLRHSLKQRPYYKEILLEVVHYFHRANAGQHSMAFLHIYRFLERISFAFPVIYAASSEDYRGAYDSLKEYISEGDKGELGFFSKFAETVIDRPLLDSSSLFQFEFEYEKENKAALHVIQRFIPDKVHNIKSETDEEIEIYNKCLLSLIINLRNRFFHFNSGQKGNIALTELPNPDVFFKGVNSTCLGWLSVIYFAVLRKNIERYVAKT